MADETQSPWASIEAMPEFQAKPPKEKLDDASYFLQRAAEKLGPELATDPEAQQHFREKSRQFLFKVAEDHFPSAFDSLPSQLGESLAREDRAITMEGARLNTEIGQQAASTLERLKDQPDDAIIPGDPETFQTVSPNADMPAGEYRKYLQGVVDAQTEKAGRKSETLAASFAESAKRTPSAAMLQLDLSEGWAGWDDFVATNLKNEKGAVGKAVDLVGSLGAAILGANAESSVQSAKGAVAGIATGIATGNPFAGGAVMGAVAADSEFQATYLSELQKELEKRGGDVSAKAIQSVLGDEDWNKGVDAKARTRGVTIGATEAVAGALSFGIANKIGTTTLKKALLGTGAEAVVGGVGGSSGEFLARLFSGEDFWTPEARKEIATEGVAELGQAGTGVVTNLAESAIKGRPKSQPEQIADVTREAAEAVAASVESAPEVAIQRDKAAELRANGLPALADALEARAEAGIDETLKGALSGIQADVVEKSARLDEIEQAMSAPGLETKEAAKLGAERDAILSEIGVDISTPAPDAPIRSVMEEEAGQMVDAPAPEVSQPDSQPVAIQGEEVNTPDTTPIAANPPTAGVTEPTVEGAPPAPEGSASAPAPAPLQTFEIDEGLRIDLTQDPDGSVRVTKTNTETGRTLPLPDAPDVFPDQKSALDYLASTFRQNEDGQIVGETAPDPVAGQPRGEQDDLMAFLQAEKMQPSQTDIRTIGRVARREAQGMRGMEKDTGNRGDYYNAPLLREFSGEAQERLRGIYSRESGNRPDTLADAAFNRGWISAPTAEALFEGIRDRLRGDETRTVSAFNNAEAEALAAQYDQETGSNAEAFYRALNSPYRRGGVINAGLLQEGDSLTLGDDTLTVTEVTEEGPTVRSERRGIFTLSSEEKVGYDAFKSEGGIPIDERDDSLPSERVDRSEVDELTGKVRESLAQKGRTWEGRVLTSAEHNLLTSNRRALDAARRLAEMFGLRIVGVTGFPGNGAVSRRDGRNIFMRVDTDRSELVIAAHELLHQLRNNQSELYSGLVGALKSDPAFQSAMSAYVGEVRGEHHGKAKDTIEEEFLADYLSERAMDPAFWESLSQKDPGLFEKLADFILKFLRDVRDRIAKDKIAVERYLADAAAMREALEQTLLAYRSEKSAKERLGLDEEFDESMPFADEMDAEYLALAQDPEANRERLQAMVDEAADKAGYNPKSRAFHGSPIKGFSIFDALKRGIQTLAPDAKLGFFFAHQDANATPGEARKYAENFAYKGGELVGEVREFYIKNENPGYYDHKGKNWRPDTFLKAVKEAKESGKSGLIIEGVKSPFTEGIHHEEVVFNSNQIKSADPVTYDESGNVIPLSQRFNPASDDIRFSDERQTKESQQAFGQPNDRPDEIQSLRDEVIPRVKAEFFDGDKPVSYWNKEDAASVINEIEAGNIDASATLEADAGNQVLLGELWRFALRALKEDGDDSLYQRLKHRVNDYFQREATVAGRVLNARGLYTRTLDELIAKVSEGKKAAVNAGAPVDSEGQRIDMAAIIDQMQREMDGLRLKIADLEAMDGKGVATWAAGVAAKAKPGKGGRKMGPRAATVDSAIEDFISKLTPEGDLVFADLQGEELNQAQFLQRVVRDQTFRSKARPKSEFVNALVTSAGVTKAKAEQLHAWATAQQKQRATAEQEDAKESSAKKAAEMSIQEKLQEAALKESKRTDRLNRKLEAAAARFEKGPGKRTPAGKSDPLQSSIAEGIKAGDKFDREAFIKRWVKDGVDQEIAARLATTIQAQIANNRAKGRKASATPSEELRSIVSRYREPVEGSQRAKSEVRKLANDVLRVKDPVGEAAFKARAKALGIPANEATDLWTDLSALRTEREAVRELNRQAKAAEQGTPEAQEADALIKRLAKSQSDTQDNRPGKPAEISLVEQLYRELFMEDRPTRTEQEFVDALSTVGVDAEAAAMLHQLGLKEKANRETIAKGKAAINAVDGPGAINAIGQELLNHPMLKIAGPVERRDMMARILEDRAGLSPLDARAAAVKFDALYVKALAEAELRIAEKYASSRNAPGFRKEPGAGKPTDKPTLFDQIRKAIRAGAYDPSKRLLDEVAKANGWTDLSDADNRRLAELDLALEEEGLTDFEIGKIKMEMAQVVQKSTMAGETKGAFREFLLAGMFSGPGTWGIQTSALFTQLVNVFGRDLLTSAITSTNPKESLNFTGWVAALQDSGRHWANALADARVALRTGQIRGVTEEEIVKAQSKLARLAEAHDQLRKDPNSSPHQKAWSGLVFYMAYTRYFFRLLSALDAVVQGLVRTYVNDVEMFSKASGMGMSKAEINRRVLAAMRVATQFDAEAERKGFKGAEKKAFINDKVTMAMHGMFAEKFTVMENGKQVERSVGESFLKQSKARSFRESAGETGVNEFQTGKLKAVRALMAAMRQYQQEGGVAAVYFVPVLRTVFNIMDRSLWYEPLYATWRLRTVKQRTEGYQVWTEKGKVASGYETMLADPSQLIRRQAERTLGILLYSSIGALLLMNRDLDDDEKWFRINPIGPKIGTPAFKQWRLAGRRPNTVQIGSGKSQITIGYRRGGFEIFNLPLTLLSSWDQKNYDYGDKAKEDPLFTFLTTALKQLSGEIAFPVREFTSRSNTLDRENLARVWGYKASQLLPANALLRFPARNRDIQDHDSMAMSFLSEIPIVQLALPDSPKLNSLGDPVGTKETSMLFMGSKVNIPMGFVESYEKLKPGQAPQDADVYMLLGDKGYFPSVKSKGQFKGEITEEKYDQFVVKRGDALKTYVKRHYGRLSRMDDEAFSKDLSAESAKITERVQNQMRLR